MKSEKVIKEIVEGKKNILTPIFDELAYIDVEITDKDNCLINLGDNYYIKTKLSKANEITKRINLEKAKKDCSIRKLDENTFEIRENIALHEEKKEKENNNEDLKIDKEKIKKEIEEENKKILEIIEQINLKKKSATKRLKLKKKEDIVETVIKKLESN